MPLADELLEYKNQKDAELRECKEQKDAEHMQPFSDKYSMIFAKNRMMLALTLKSLIDKGMLKKSYIEFNSSALEWDPEDVKNQYFILAARKYFAHDMITLTFDPIVSYEYSAVGIIDANVCVRFTAKALEYVLDGKSDE